ncbi:hypothetical protein [Methylomagnum sp.]
MPWPWCGSTASAARWPGAVVLVRIDRQRREVGKARPVLLG